MIEPTDTPETDKALQGVWYHGDHGSAIPALCRKLERENGELRAEVERLKAELIKAYEPETRDDHDL